MTTYQEKWRHSLTEIAGVLDNYEIILKQVEEMDHTYQDSHTGQLLYIIFGLYMPRIESELSSLIKQSEVRNIARNAMATVVSMKQSYIESKNYQLSEGPYMSPVILLIKLADKKGRISFARCKSRNKHQWGRVAPYCKYLKQLQFQSRTGHQVKYWPGLPGCILSLVPIWTSHEAVISASYDLFSATRILEEVSHDSRRRQLSSLRQSCAPDVARRIQDLQDASNRIINKYEAWKRQKELYSLAHAKKSCPTQREYIQWVSEHGTDPVHLPGTVATWAPSGHYTPPCLVDYWRFRTLRPPRAEELDQNDWEKNEHDEWVIKKQVFGVQSCAEWDAFLQLSSLDNSKVSVLNPTLW